MNERLNRTVTREKLVELGFTPEQAKLICRDAEAVAWTKLARIDGGTALRALDEEEYRLIANALVAEGLPPEQVAEPKGLIQVLVAVANFDSPKGDWYDPALVSAVACAKLLSLAQQAWGYNEEVAAANESAAFAKTLGVRP